jgi:hypothetical protein
MINAYPDMLWRDETGTLYHITMKDFILLGLFLGVWGGGGVGSVVGPIVGVGIGVERVLPNIRGRYWIRSMGFWRRAPSHIKRTAKSISTGQNRKTIWSKGWLWHAYETIPSNGPSALL